MINIDILNNLFTWVVAPLEKSIKSEELKEHILKYFSELPNQINEHNEPITYTYDGFILDMLNYVEYSNKIIFLLLNGGRKYLLKFLKIIYYLLIPVFILPFFLVRYFEILNYISVYIVAGFLLFAAIILFLIDKTSDKIIKTMKPGDLLKILDAPDENFPITKTEYSLSKNEYEKITVVESKKRHICRHYRKLVNINTTKNLHELMVYYFATQFLTDIEYNEEIIMEYREQINQVLEYILAFRRDSTYTLFYMAHNELNMLLLEKSLKHFLDYQNIVKSNLNVNAWIIVLKFISENSMITDQDCAEQ